MTWEVVESTKKAAAKSRHVRIDAAAVKRLARTWVEQGVRVPAWDREHHFFDGTERTVAYFMVLDTLNFCFWPPPATPKWWIPYQGRMLSGYHALAAGLKQALARGVPLTSAAFLADLSLETLRQILGGAAGLQLMEQRLQSLQELGQRVLADYGGHLHHLREEAGDSAIGLTRLLASRLASFRDVAFLEGEPVYLYKRAQILGADLYGAFSGRSWGRFSDIHRLTAFADYKLPQVMRQLGILQYTEGLARKVAQGVLLEPGSRQEVEIRANAVCAVERIREALKQHGREIPAFQVDWILWNLGQRDRFRRNPYHRTLTVYY